MNPDFRVERWGEISLLVYSPWWDEGIVHGMTLREMSFKGTLAAHDAALVAKELEGLRIALPRQNHGDSVFDARHCGSWLSQHADQSPIIRLGEHDALIAPPCMGPKVPPVAFGVATADCVPVIIRGATSWGIVHAGWRGLANGIIAKVADVIGELEHVAIFACAGGERYEVGPEVLEQIGATAVCFPSANGKFRLDTAETARRQLQPFIPVSRVALSEVCTISDERFHSHRRDAEQAGRAITFVIPPQARP